MVVPIEKLFTRNRCPSGPSLLFVILYTPLGLVLFLLRLFISLQLCLAFFVLPANTLIRRFVLRVLYLVMGVAVFEENRGKKDGEFRVIVANHITPFDHVAVSLVLPCITVKVFDMPSPVAALLCYRDFGVTQGREVLRTNAQAYLAQSQSQPLLFHPEGATTNGEAAVMKYGSWAFDIENSVLAVGLRVWRLPLISIAPSVLGASWAADLFFTLFSPVTVFTVRYVGKMVRGEGESLEDFAHRVQAETAASINLIACAHTVSDKVEYIKRLAREEAMAANPLLNPEVHSMALQVKEVLPYLPIDIIKRDLVRTRNVDMTITNFLEGNIPEPIPEVTITSDNERREGETTSYFTSVDSHSTDTSSSAQYGHNVGTSGDEQSSASSSTSASPAHTASKSKLESSVGSNLSFSTAGSFSKSAYERMQSFQQRKAQLIENARRKYIERHALKIPGYSC